MKKFIALVLALAGVCGALQAGTLAEKGENTAVTDPDNDSAQITLADTVKGTNITFFDGGQENKQSSTYNEKVLIEGVSARKFYGGNHAYFRLAEKFYDKKKDHAFFIRLTFYQFGPERGTFNFQYASESGLKSVTITKEKDPMWVTHQFFIGDAYFDHSIDEQKADIKIVSGAYNAFAKLEVINAKSIMYDNDFNVGTVSASRAKTLSQLGLYAIDENSANYLENKLTKASAAAKIVKIIGREAEAKKCSSVMTGATDEEKQAIGYLQHEGFVNWSGKANTDITQTELIEIFAAIQGISCEGDVIQNAIDNGLLQKSDMMMQPNKTATDDNLIALGYHWLLLPGRHGKENIVEMMNNNLIDEEKLKDVSETRIRGLYYTKPRVIDKVEVIDPKTGRKYYYIENNGAPLVREYYTANLWTADNKRFIVEDSWEGSPKYLYDTEKSTLQYLDFCYNIVVSKDTDRMYYMYSSGSDRQVRRIDLNTLKIEKVADIPYNLTGSEDATITNDEKYYAVNWEEGSDKLDYATPFGGFRKRKVPVLNIETGVWDNTFHHEFVGFNREGMILNHVQINPVYDNIALFAHEGTAENTPDRIWVVDLDKNEEFNVFRQKQVTEKITGEPAGHEMWFGNGERIAFVKYPKRDNIAYSGIATVDITGKHKEYLNSQYQYWHCAASPANDRFIVADTNNNADGTVEIVLIDRYTGEAQLLCKPRLGYWQHPGHAHPSFSQDGKKIAFAMKGASGAIVTGWMDISDIVDKPAVGGRVSISEDCEVPSYKGTVNYIEPANIGGFDCYKVPARKKMLINVKDDKYQGDRVDATVSFSYYDWGYTPVRLVYFGWNENLMRLDKTDQMRYEIERRNTKKWKTVTVELKDINLDNMEYIGTDFRIEGVYSDIYVKDINVEVTNVISDFMDQRKWSALYMDEE